MISAGCRGIHFDLAVLCREGPPRFGCELDHLFIRVYLLLYTYVPRYSTHVYNNVYSCTRTLRVRLHVRVALGMPMHLFFLFINLKITTYSTCTVRVSEGNFISSCTVHVALRVVKLYCTSGSTKVLSY